jgi:hypothetical protein
LSWPTIFRGLISTFFLGTSEATKFISKKISFILIPESFRIQPKKVTMRMSLTAILSLAVILLVQLAAEEFRVDGKTTKKPKPAAIQLLAKREATTTSSPAPSSSSTTVEATKQDDGAGEAEAISVPFLKFLR